MKDLYELFETEFKGIDHYNSRKNATTPEYYCDICGEVSYDEICPECLDSIADQNNDYGAMDFDYKLY